MKRIFFLTLLFVTIVQVIRAQVEVLTQHNDGTRAGWNKNETSLTTANVNSNTFGLYFSRAVDDDVLGQPLVVTGVNIPGVGVRNVVYVTTGNNSVYAFDADSPSVSAPYWSINLTPAGVNNKPPNPFYIHPGLCNLTYTDFQGNFGIVGTPVIDKSSNTIYLVSRYMDVSIVDNRSTSTPGITELSYSSVGFYPTLFAIDITNGTIKKSVPITATANGTGDGNVGGVITLDPRRQFNRSGLVLSGGIVYVPFAAHCDWNYYHGWILGYDAATLTQKIVYITTPNDGKGGIWMSGAAPAVDASGNLFFTTGNSSTTDPTNVVNRGESVVKITPNPATGTTTISSWFTPLDYSVLNSKDNDFDVEVMLIPNSTLAITGIKGGKLYLMDQNSLGGFDPNTDHVLSETNLGTSATMHTNLAYFKSSTTEYIYIASENIHVKAFPLNRSTNTLGASIDNAVNVPQGLSGGYLATSSNDTIASSAIVWLYQADNGCNANQFPCTGILRALQATNISNELWNSDQVSADAIGNFSKMNSPTIANGKVYLATRAKNLAVYGLKASATCMGGPNIALNKPALASSEEPNSTCSTQNCVAAAAFDGNMATRWSSLSSDPQWIYVDLGQDYDLCGVTIEWEAAYASDYNIDVSEDATNWTTIKAVTGNTSQSNVLTLSGTGRYVRMFGISRATSFGYSIWEMAVYGKVHNSCSTPTLNTPTNIMQNSVTLGWQPVTGATSYYLQYKATTVNYWTNISTSSTSVNLSALTCGQDYSYQVQAICASSNSSFAASGFTTSACTNPCTLPTRYIQADIGAVGQAGMSCYDGSTGTFIVQGSGAGLVGTADAFQFAWTNISLGDSYYTARIVTQDATNPNNMIGLMMRDSITPWSRFAYIARTSGNNFVFSYRSVTGGSVTSVSLSVGSPNLPYFVKIQKTGNSYSGYISSDGLLSWTQIGTSVNLNFGSNPINVGIAITSANNGALSNGTVDTYLDGVALPVKFGNLTATNIDDEYADIRWTTNMEVLNDHFEVQRSTDGIRFYQIATVKGAGTTDIPQNYSVQDYHPEKGKNYYRIKQVDLDGRATFSQIVSVKFGKLAGPILYPNPAKAYFTVESGQQLVKEIRVLSVSGQEIIHMTNVSGWNTVNIPCSQLQVGLYMVQLKTDNQTYQQKLIVQ